MQKCLQSTKIGCERYAAYLASDSLHSLTNYNVSMSLSLESMP